MAFTQGHALVIGVGSYQAATNLDVPQTARDAEAIARILCDEQFCGYPANQVCVLRAATATRDGIRNELNRLAKVLTENDTFFLFYSGHGMIGADGYYLTTYDTQIEGGKVITGTGIREAELLEQVKAIGTRRALLVFNACHAGALTPDALGEPPAPLSLGEPLPEALTDALLSAGEGRSIITACRAPQRSWFSRAEPTTLFAQALADGLQGQGLEPRRGYISLFDLYDYVYTTVNGTVRRRWDETQEPELTISKGVGVMALALYRGATPSGDLGSGDRPRALGGAVREVDQAKSAQLFDQIVNGQRNVTAGRDLHYDTHTEKHTNTGNINVGDIHGSGIAIGHEAKVEMNTIHMGSSVPPPPIVSLSDGLAQVRSAVQLAHTQRNTTLTEDLAEVVTSLEAALNAETTGDIGRRSAKFSRAYADLQAIAQQQPQIGALATLIAKIK